MKKENKIQKHENTKTQKQENKKTFFNLFSCFLVFVFSCFFVFLFSTFFSFDVLAADDTTSVVNETVGLDFAGAIGLSDTDPRIVVAKLIRAFLGFMGTLTIILIVYAGFIVMNAKGDAKKIEDAKNIIKNATIGLTIMLASMGILTFIIGIIGTVFGNGSPGDGGDGSVPGGGSYYSNPYYGDPGEEGGRCLYNGAIESVGSLCTNGYCNLEKPELSCKSVSEEENSECRCFSNPKPIITSISPQGGFCKNDNNKFCKNNSDCKTDSVATDDENCDTSTPNGKANSSSGGTDGNLITIHGSGFGTTQGTVTFLGGDGDSDDKLGVLNACTGITNWTDTQIIVRVPYQAVTGKIIVKNITNSLIGTSSQDFIVNAIDRPGLCSISPANGEPQDEITYTGLKFSDPFKAYFGKNILAFNNTFISNTQGSSTVPSITTGKTTTFVTKADIPSNNLAFTNNYTDIDKPQITSIDPLNGPVGTYITIRGVGFGALKNQSDVYFSTDIAKDDNDKKADYNFPVICADSLWSSTQIIVKVPDSVKSTGSDTTKSYYLILNKKDTKNNIDYFAGSDNIQEVASQQFTVNDKSLPPGLCKIDPSFGPQNTTISLWGEYFDAKNDTNSVICFKKDGINFIDKKGDDISFWGKDDSYDKNKPDKATTKVPADVTTVNENGSITINSLGAISGPVRVAKDGGTDFSNGLNFEVGSCLAKENGCSEQETNTICCPQNSFQAGACVLNAKDCYGSVNTCTYEWDFSTGLAGIGEPCGTISGDSCSPTPDICKFGLSCKTSDAATSTDFCTCQPTLTCRGNGSADMCIVTAQSCPNSPGRCDLKNIGTTGGADSCGDNFCNQKIECGDDDGIDKDTEGTLCEYDIKTNKCKLKADTKIISTTGITTITPGICSESKAECRNEEIKFKIANNCLAEKKLNADEDDMCEIGVCSDPEYAREKVTVSCEAKDLYYAKTEDADCDIGFTPEPTVSPTECHSKNNWKLSNSANCVERGGFIEGKECFLGTKDGNNRHPIPCQLEADKTFKGEQCLLEEYESGGVKSGGLVCKAGTKCDLVSNTCISDQECECCCKVQTDINAEDYNAGAGPDCCIGLNCTDNLCVDTGYGLCTGCKLSNDSDFTANDNACNCTGTTNKYCETLDTSQKGYDIGVCLSKKNCGDVCRRDGECQSDSCVKDDGNDVNANGSETGTCSCTPPPQCNPSEEACDCCTVGDIKDCKKEGSEVLVARTCGTGKVLIGGIACIDATDKPTGGNCESGKVEVSGKCITATDKSTDGNCESGKVEVSGKCVTDSTVATCPSEYPIKVSNLKKRLTCIEKDCSETIKNPEIKGLFCGCDLDNQCATQPAEQACGTDTCCRPRPEVESVVPANSAQGICANAMLSVTFNGLMDQSSFKENLIVGYFTKDACPDDSYFIGTKPKSSNWFAKLINRFLNFANATALADQNFCITTGAISSETNNSNPANPKTILIFSAQKGFKEDTQYFAIVKGDSDLTDEKKEGVLNEFGIGMKVNDINEINLFELIKKDSKELNSVKKTTANGYKTINSQNLFGRFWTFKTDKICPLQAVRIDPATKLFQTAQDGVDIKNGVETKPCDENESTNTLNSENTCNDKDHVFTASAWYEGNDSGNTSNDQEISPIDGVYSWNWSWNLSSDDIFNNTTKSTNFSETPNKNFIKVKDDNNQEYGKADLTAEAEIQIDINGDDDNDPKNKNEAKLKKSATSNLTLFLCNNPWPPIKINDGTGVTSWSPWQDNTTCSTGLDTGDCANYNFELYYCRDNNSKETANDDLPAIHYTVGTDALVSRGACKMGEVLIEGVCIKGVAKSGSPAICNSNKNEKEVAGVCITGVAKSGNPATCGTAKEVSDVCLTGTKSGNYNKEVYFLRTATADRVTLNSIAAEVTGNKATLSWTALNLDLAPAKYKVYYSQTEGNYKEILQDENCATLNTVCTTVIGTSSTAIIFNLTNNKKYYFVVTAIDANGTESEFSDPLSVDIKDTTAPTAPTIQIVDNSITSNSFKVEITNNATLTDVEKYIIDYGVHEIKGTVRSHGVQKQINRDITKDKDGNIKNQIIDITGLNPGTRYYISASSTDASGNGATGIATTTYTKMNPISKIKNIETGDNANGIVIVYWDKSTDANVTEYKVYYTKDKIKYNNPATVTTLSQEITGLTKNTTYYFSIVAVFPDGDDTDSNPDESPHSQAVSFKALDKTNPNKPTIGNITTKTESSITIPISNNSTLSDTVTYNIYYGTETGVYNKSKKGINKTENITLDGLTASTKYYFKVTAVDGAGNESEKSNENNATTTPAS